VSVGISSLWLLIGAGHYIVNPAVTCVSWFIRKSGAVETIQYPEMFAESSVSGDASSRDGPYIIESNPTIQVKT
jgi:hypothetical protein